jgi:hypothetical protein
MGLCSMAGFDQIEGGGGGMCLPVNTASTSMISSPPSTTGIAQTVNTVLWTLR